MFIIPMMNGLLLVNLGSPQSPSKRHVRQYLREFLSDPDVIDIPYLFRKLLLYGVILPFRTPKTAQAYQKIWTPQGSPLLVYSQQLRDSIANRLPSWNVQLAMRYGKPSIKEAIETFKTASINKLVVFPLYPQYATSSTETALKQIKTLIPESMPLQIIPPFYDHPAFINAFASQGKERLNNQHYDHVLFSYHGLPQRQIAQLDKTNAHCFVASQCCDAIIDANQDCYRAHCLATSKALAKALQIPDHLWSMSFQSRLGRTPWITPYTDEEIPKFAKQNIKNLIVFSPSFVADCLETLEEIQIRAQELFCNAGGETLILIPSLNASPLWCDAIVDIVHQHTP